MIDGHLPQPRLEDLRPIRTHWALIGIVLLMAPLYWIALKFHPEFAVTSAAWGVAMTGIFFSGFLIFTGLLGGPQRIWTDWRDRNWYGYFSALWQTKPNHLDGHFVNRKNLPNVVMPGWSLHMPLGGWFNRPFLSHSKDRPRRSHNFRITRVKWDWLGTVETVTVRDHRGNVRITHPANLLKELEMVFPDGDRSNQMRDGLNYLAMAAETREHRLACDLADRTEAFQQQHALAAAGIGVIWETIWDIFKTSRLDGVKSKEGQTVREKVTAYYRSLESMPGAAVHDFRLLLPVNKKSGRPERISADGPVQKMF